MRWSAAALVTACSFAAPSSIEYSVCTCRFAKESDGLLTGGRAPQWSNLPTDGTPAGDRWGRPALQCSGSEGSGGAPTILALQWVYAEGLTERVSHRTPGPHPCLRQARQD